MFILHCIIFSIYHCKNAATVRVQTMSRISWELNYVLRNSILNIFWNKSKCLKYNWWSVSININRVARNREMPERFTRWAFDGMWAGRGAAWGLGTQIWYVFVSRLPMAPALNGPQETTLFDFSVTLSCPGLAWEDRGATEERKWSKTEAGGWHGNEQAPAASAAESWE